MHRWTPELLVQLLLPHTEDLLLKDPCRCADWQNLLLAVQGGSSDAMARLPEALEQLRHRPEEWAGVSTLLGSCLPIQQDAILQWAEQLVGLLEQPHGVCVIALLLELARAVPQQLYFAFATHWPPPLPTECAVAARQLNKALAGLPTECAVAVRQLNELLRNPVLAQVQIGMEYLFRADCHIRRYLDEIRFEVQKGDRAAALVVFREMQHAVLLPRP